MDHLYTYALVACLLLGLLVFAWLLKALRVTLEKSAVPSGFNFASVSILGRSFLLIEITALQRMQYLQRCTKLSALDGFELMGNDLKISTDLIALHLRRWYLPRGFIAFRIRQLSAATLAELFRQCVQLSGLPFSIVKDDESDDSLQHRDSQPDDWDYVDDEDEKKSRPAVRQ